MLYWFVRVLFAASGFAVWLWPGPWGVGGGGRWMWPRAGDETYERGSKVLYKADAMQKPRV